MFILMLIMLISIAGILYILLNKKEEIKEPLIYNDFAENLAHEYQLLNCNITDSKIEFYLSGIKDSYYTALCKNIENHMKGYSQTKENANQKDFEIYIYKNNTKNSIKEDAEAIIYYHLYDTNCMIEKSEKLPNTDKTDGLLPYEFIDFDGLNLTVSMDLSELSLLEKGKQMKVLYTIACELNYIDNLVLKVKENDNITYIYDGSNSIKIIETRDINY